MREVLHDCEVLTPSTLNEVLSLLHEQPGAYQLMAGCTDLLVQLSAGKIKSKKFINLSRLDAIKGILERDGNIQIGALSTFSEIAEHPLLKMHTQLLCEAAHEVGARSIQNRATLGGNIMNASPAADSLPPLLVSNAAVELLSTSGSRTVKLQDFYTGYKKTVLKSDELLGSIFIPKREGLTGVAKVREQFRKVGSRRAQTISKISFAARGELNRGVLKEIRIAFGSVGPFPVRCLKTENILLNQTIERAKIEAAKKCLMTELNPVDDLRSNQDYRRRVSMNLLEDFLYSFGVNEYVGQ